MHHDLIKRLQATLRDIPRPWTIWSFRKKNHVLDTALLAIVALEDSVSIEKGLTVWRPIETLDKSDRTMFVAIGIDITLHNGRKYSTDPYCVWINAQGEFARWPHPFPPTHWMPLPRTDQIDYTPNL